MKWVPAWSYLPINYNFEWGTVENQTQRMILENNLNGNKVRLKFTNLYSTNVLVLNTVTIGLKKKDGHGLIEKITRVTLKQKEEIILQPGQEVYSDEVLLDVDCNENLVVSIYVKDTLVVQTGCSVASRELLKVLNSEAGDFTSQQTFGIKSQESLYRQLTNEPIESRMTIAYGVTEVQVLTEDSVKIITAFGDSITHMSFWTGPFAKRLYKAYPGAVTLVNRGIGGNRILRDPAYAPDVPGQGKCFGEAGIKRFERDVYGDFVTDIVLILEGINDMGFAFYFNLPEEKVSANDLIEGLGTYIQIARNYGSKVYIGTVIPSRNDQVQWFPEIDECRQSLNQWIRENKTIDGVMDFDRAIRDKKNPEYMLAQYHLGDGVHPNSIGGNEMAQNIPLEWFQ